MNVSGALNIFRLVVNPSLCLPHHTIATFDQLPIPLSAAFANKNGEKKPDIRAVVLDKDNCFAIPKQNAVYQPYQSKFDELRKAFPGSKLLIVSNSSGTASDPGYKEAELLQRNTGVQVLQHRTKKPGCHAEIMEHFRSRPETGVTSESHVAIVGDRLFTDVMMANMMGSYGLWIRDGPMPDHGFKRVFLDSYFAEAIALLNPKANSNKALLEIISEQHSLMPIILDMEKPAELLLSSLDLCTIGKPEILERERQDVPQRGPVGIAAVEMNIHPGMRTN